MDFRDRSSKTYKFALEKVFLGLEIRFYSASGTLTRVVSQDSLYTTTNI